MKIYIKNMVCNRCIMAVSGIFSDAGYGNARVEMGKVTIDSEISDAEMHDIEKALNETGFELISDARSRLIEQIKKLTIEYVYKETGEKTRNFSDYLADKLNLDYNYLSSLFSSVEGTTIEKHLISLKIERVKELLVYDEMTLSEIAFELGYSSVAHLSGQFKKVTGFTPSYFKNLGDQKRQSIDKV
ncbi:helix-turn-helix domain-containing protein [Saccharicrinis sp. FJH54]|uniref:helix-turn-helix domain-containing protein n=1 Tax=Saccharicrinis sp. FJH54 TaxID=3344665 RepID=UPI0035D4FD7C